MTLCPISVGGPQPLSRSPLAAFFLLLVWCTASICVAQSSEELKEQASAHFRQGVELFREGAFRAAEVELKRAYETLPDYRVLFNIGQTQQMLGEYVDAQHSLEQYLDKGGEHIAIERRIDVESQLSELHGHIASLSINVNEGGANVYIDGKRIGTSPIFASIPVSAGRHQVLAESDEGGTSSTCIDIAGGEYLDLNLSIQRPVLVAMTPEFSSSPAQEVASELEPAVVEQAPVEVAQLRRPHVAPILPEATQLSRRDRWGVGLASVGGAVALGAGVLGLGFTLKARSEYRHTVETSPDDMNKVVAARRRYELYSRMTDGFAATALALGVASAVLLLVDEGDSVTTAPEQRPRVKLDVGVSPQSVAVAGTF
jgi:hypothetical protein